jgi:hypothetical protein
LRSEVARRVGPRERRARNEPGDGPGHRSKYTCRITFSAYRFVTGRRPCPVGHRPLAGARARSAEATGPSTIERGSGSHSETLLQVPQHVQAHALGWTVFHSIIEHPVEAGSRAATVPSRFGGRRFAHAASHRTHCSRRGPRARCSGASSPSRRLIQRGLQGLVLRNNLSRSLSK